MRSKLGPKVIGGVIAVITFVFIFYGIFMPGSGSQGPGVAGEVNGETISFTEFSRALNQRMEFFRNMMGGKVSEAQLEQFHVGESVFQDLAQRKVLAQTAKKEGFGPSAEAIRDQIMKMEVFKKDGRFDKVAYKNVLAANQLTQVRFEELIATELAEQEFKDFLGKLAYVSSPEVEGALRVSKARHKIKYLYLDNESARKLLPQGLKAEEQGAKLNEKVAETGKMVLPLLSSGADAKINASLKDAKVQVKTSEWLSAQSNVIPGVGSVRSVQDALFSMKKGSPAQAFTLMGGTLFAVTVGEESYDPASVTAKERTEAEGRIRSEKENELLRGLVGGLMKKAKISRNDRVVTGGKGAAVPVTADQ